MGHLDTKMHLFIILSQCHRHLSEISLTALVQGPGFKPCLCWDSVWLSEDQTCGQGFWLGWVGTLMHNRKTVCRVFHTANNQSMAKADALIITKQYSGLYLNKMKSGGYSGVQLCFNSNPEPNIPLLNDCLQNVPKYLNRNWLQWQITDHHFSGRSYTTFPNF